MQDVIDCRRFVDTRDYNVLVDLLLRWLDAPKPSRQQLLNLTIPQMSLLQVAFAEVLREKTKTGELERIGQVLSIGPLTPTH